MQLLINYKNISGDIVKISFVIAIIIVFSFLGYFFYSAERKHASNSLATTGKASQNFREAADINKDVLTVANVNKIESEKTDSSIIDKKHREGEPLSVSQEHINANSGLCENSIEDEDCDGLISSSVEDNIIDLSSNQARTNEVINLLIGDDFYQVPFQLEEERIDQDILYKQQDINQALFSKYLDVNKIQSNGFSCGDKVCVAYFTYGTESDWEDFEKVFFDSDPAIGNLFVAEVNNEKRVLFLLNNRNAIIQ